jgi:hypothetical protein
VKHLFALTLALVAGGCAGMRQPQARPIQAESPQYTEASASALAFDPPIDEGAPHPEFARAARQPSVFLGFDEPSSEFYLRATSDLQTNVFGDFYAQQSLSVKSGTRSR